MGGKVREKADQTGETVGRKEPGTVPNTASHEQNKRSCVYEVYVTYVQSYAYNYMYMYI